MPSFWDDEELAKLSPWARLLAAFLITGRQAVQLPGLVSLGVRGLTEAAQFPTDEITAGALAELCKEGFAQFDGKRLIRVPNAPQFNPPRNRMMVRGWFRRWGDLPETKLRYEHVRAILAVCAGYGGEIADEANKSFGNVNLDCLETNNGQTRVGLETYGVGVGVGVVVSQEVLPGVSEGVSAPAREVAKPGPKPKERRRTSILAKWRTQVMHLWDRQRDLRRGVSLKARELAATDDALRLVADRLEEGYSVEDCEHVLEVYADDARRDAKARPWFNGETNWRPENFRRALGKSVGGGARASPANAPRTKNGMTGLTYEQLIADDDEGAESE